MATELTLPKSFGKLPGAFKGAPATNEELGQGVAASYAVMGYRGKVWMVKFGGEEVPLMRDDGDGPRHSIEVVIVKANPAISKIFYKQGYTDGSNQKPDCWSANGITPDPSVQEKVSPTCGNCPMNAWGSRISEAGKQVKACADSRRTAIVPLNDIDNEATGGPMLLRIPAASLKDLKAYGDLLAQHNFPYYAAATRIAFDPAEAFPKFEFTALRPLTDEEANKIVELRADKRVGVVLAEVVDPASLAGATVEGAAPVTAKSPFEQAAVTPEVTPKATAAKANGAAKPAATAPKAAAKPAAAKPAAKAPVAEPEVTKAATPEQALAAKIAAARKRAADAAAAAAAELEALEAQAGSEEETVEETEEETVEETEEEVTEESNDGQVPAEFDAMLDNLLG